MSKYKVLFVCTGNICRSPMAEAIFRHQIISNDLSNQFECDSAATQNYHINEEADNRVLNVLKKYKIPNKNLVARQFELSDYEKFDLILGMAMDHLLFLRQNVMHSQHSSKIHLFLDYSLDLKNQNVPDPYYGNNIDFEKSFELIDNAITHLIGKLCSRI